MLCKMKKLKLLVIMMSCVLLTGSIFPGKLFADTVIEEWVARYNGPGNSSDYASAMAVDSSGNVYVTGRSHSYSSGTSDYATVKYDPSGAQLWVATYDGPGNFSDVAKAIAVDSSGNVYVTGESRNSGTEAQYADYATVKYDTDGTELWVARYNGPGNSRDYVRAIAVDGSGNVYVTGDSFGGDSSYDSATVKYDGTNGDEVWVARYNGPGNSHDGAHAIAVDGSDNVYVTGASTGSGTGLDYTTIKYDAATGNELWVARYNGPGNWTDLARAIAVDTSGNVYVTGASPGGGTYRYDDYATVKYDTEGNELWVARYNGLGNRWDLARAIAVDTSGNVYVTGASYSGIGTSGDYATVKYDAATGNELWVARYNGPANSSDGAQAIAVDTLGNVYVTGYSLGSGGTGWDYADYATVKYDTSGNELWVATYNGPGNSSDAAYAIAVDSSGNVYVTGFSVGIGTDDDYATIKYSQPDALLLGLVQDVIALNLQQGISNGLDAKLDAALQALDDINANNDAAAINALDAFINHVQAQRGNKILEADADALIAAAQEIIDILSGT